MQMIFRITTAVLLIICTLVLLPCAAIAPTDSSRIIIEILPKQSMEILPISISKPLKQSIPQSLDDVAKEHYKTVNVWDVAQGKMITLPENEYILGVVAAEMPALYNIEAIKAQAIAARTYLERKISCGGCNEHEGADICTASGHCQGYCNMEARYNNWKDKYDEYEEKLSSAVRDTTGMVITYNGQLIDAMYHSCSFRCTESSENAYGNYRPYLISSPTPEDEANITTVVEYDFDTYLSIILKNVKDTHININYFQKQTGIAKRTDTERVKLFRLGSVTVTGAKMRVLFGLRSTDFDFTIKNNKVVFTVRGYGHCVGMSQIGANILAKNGYTCIDILKNYYNGTEIVTKPEKY